MTDMPQERTDLPQQPYRPFPTFAEFSATDEDLSVVDAFVDMLSEARTHASPEQLDSTLRRATKWAAVDTGAIEGLYDVDRGFTITVAKSTAAWSAMGSSIGEPAARSISDALAAYDMVLDLVTREYPVMEASIRHLHEILCHSQDTYEVETDIGRQAHILEKGTYKSRQNNPYSVRRQLLHSYAPVMQTPAEMERLVQELNTVQFRQAHSVVQAAYAHYAFVCVHPFADGNGRVARALASVYLYRSPGIPLVIFADQKHDYFDALEAADAGRFELLVRFFADRVADVSRAIGTDIRRPSQPSIEELRKSVEAKFRGPAGLPPNELDALAGRLLNEWATTLEESSVITELAATVSIFISRQHRTQSPRQLKGYRYLRDARSVSVEARVESSGDELRREYMPVVARLAGQRADVVLVHVDAEDAMLVEEALVRELDPTLGTPLKYRLTSAAESELMEVVRQVAGLAE